jgi:peroxiredoxin
MRTFHDRNDLPFDLVDDGNREAIDPYDVAFDSGAVGSGTSPSTRCPT